MQKTIAMLVVLLFTVPSSAAVPQDIPAAIYTDPPRDAAHPARMEVLHIPSGGVNINGVACLVPRQHQWHRFDVVILGVFWSHRSDKGTKTRPKHFGQPKDSGERVVRDILCSGGVGLLPRGTRVCKFHRK